MSPKNIPTLWIRDPENIHPGSRGAKKHWIPDPQHFVKKNFLK
jgi:hypothetical protein